MKYRIILALSFDDEGESLDAWDKVKDAWDKAAGNADDSANYHLCYHDEDPVKPCEVIEELP